MSNSITLVGNLTREPELRSSSTPAVNLGLAVNRRWRGANGEWEESTSFFTVIAWRDLAVNAAASLHRGDRVVVVGRVEQRSWADETGNRRSTVEVVAEEIGAALRWRTASFGPSKVERDTSLAPIGADSAALEAPF